MHDSRSRRRLFVPLVLLLLPLVTPARADDLPLREDLVAALRARVMRPVSERALLEEARRLQARLTAAELDSVIAGGDLPARLRRRPALRAPRLRAATAEALGDSTSDLVFVPLAPCRVFDTRLAGGAFAANETRPFRIAGTDLGAQGGNPGGCGVPLGATTPAAAAIALDLVAVSAQGYGWVTAWEFGQPMPTASVLNYANVGTALDLANAFIVPISGVASLTHDLELHAANSAVHLAGDVTGYFTRVPIEEMEERFQTLVRFGENLAVDVGDGACKWLVVCTVAAPVAGQVIVDVQAQVEVNHTAGTTDRFVLQVETSDTVTCPVDDGLNASDHEVSSGAGSDPGVDFTLRHARLFSQAADEVVTYQVSGVMRNGASAGDLVESTRALCTFVPN